MPSHTITQHKNSLQSIQLYIEPSSLTKNLQTELNHLKIALQKNGHDKKDIIKTINKHANKTLVSVIQSDERILSTLPYVKGTTDRIGRILNKYNDRTIFNYPTIFNPPKNIRQILRNPKDQRPQFSSAGVYKISCSCGQVYIGETERRSIYR